MSWAKIVTKKQPVVEEIEVETQVKPVAKNNELPTEPNEYENIRDRFSFDITEVYCDICDEVRSGSYGFVYSEDRLNRGSSFTDLIHRNIDYGLFISEGDDRGDDNDSSEDEYWWDRRNRFAYK